ncbi:DsrE/DsrF-like family protein [Novipirellula artificiosorum]|uniref:DsrE/DsrF-like family protein n=2 Tax=Novipirellula artificiosorum TaxID=2528016 RepID=A0A5C6D4I6_9BACT|nr:DsrE/DsrF-like family protein [Novipirellula artificiosorum]
MSRPYRVVLMIALVCTLPNSLLAQGGRGFDEAMKNHPVPEQPSSAAPPSRVVGNEAPRRRIENFGAVVPLPTAAAQPRSGSKILVDLTGGGAPELPNRSIETVARFVNIYSAAGEKNATASFVVVLHGDAVLMALNSDAYGERFDTDGNPNFEVLRALHESGVEFYVCGQSLIKAGAKPEEVLVFADVAVSALTALVNLQADGYAYVPLP